MSIVRFTVAGSKSAPVRSVEEGTGEALVTVDVETDIAETERGRAGGHQRDVVVAALEKVLAAVKAGGKSP